MDKIELQLELCKLAANLLRENCRNKMESDEILDMALDVIIKTLEAVGRATHDTAKEKE